MLQALIQLALFAAKAFIIFIFILLILILFVLLIAKSKEKTKGRLIIKDINKKYFEATEMILAETAHKKELKQFFKDKKAEEKLRHKSKEKTPTIYVINFVGDIRASAVASLCEEITAILTVANPYDEVVVKVDSAGGVVHGYGLAAAELLRIRKHQIPLTIIIDKIAASGGYLMACVANKILAAPFAIVGSIGVIVQLPNFHRFLKDRHIDFEQETAGEYKRTITVFGENTPDKREKLQEELEHIHSLFKNLIKEHRPQIDIKKVATGEHWLGVEALKLKLVDDIQTSEEYLFEKSKTAKIYEVCYEMKKPLLSKIAGSASLLRDKLAMLFR